MIGNHYNPRSSSSSSPYGPNPSPPNSMPTSICHSFLQRIRLLLGLTPSQGLRLRCTLGPPGSTVTYSISIVRKIREHFPHVKPYKVLLAVESNELKNSEKKRKHLAIERYESHGGKLKPI
ncbi:hypothetical protein DVH24_001619 [Malus domestica]|uniref:Uncharacterized protein n=1 Tax=Malus domestica TaxID=3750 RepID=A0A498KTY0_MALDO|nr:hypothetical protein DVH24_001619 [Malus domestica]